MQTHHSRFLLSPPCDNIGKKIEHLTILREVAKRKGERYVLCLCDCGIEKEILWRNVRQNKVQSCGCIRASLHGYRTSALPLIPETWVWYGMIHRCEDPNSVRFHRYGARGIKVCDRWRHSFENFYHDVGPRPGPEYSIDRIDNNGDYEPSNVRWATPVEQGENRTDTIWITYKGETLSLSRWAEKYDINRGTLRSRLDRGLSLQDALEKPVRHKISSASTFAISPGKA